MDRKEETNNTKIELAAYNRIYMKLAVQWFYEDQFSIETFAVEGNFVLRNRELFV